MPIQPNGPEIRRRRTSLGMSVRGFATHVGIGYSELSNIEKEKKGASPDTLKKIASGLGCLDKNISYIDYEHISAFIPRDIYDALKNKAPPGEADWQSSVLREVLAWWLKMQENKKGNPKGG